MSARNGKLPKKYYDYYRSHRRNLKELARCILKWAPQRLATLCRIILKSRNMTAAQLQAEMTARTEGQQKHYREDLRIDPAEIVNMAAVRRTKLWQGK